MLLLMEQSMNKKWCGEKKNTEIENKIKWNNGGRKER